MLKSWCMELHISSNLNLKAFDPILETKSFNHNSSWELNSNHQGSILRMNLSFKIALGQIWDCTTKLATDSNYAKSVLCLNSPWVSSICPGRALMN